MSRPISIKRVIHTALISAFTIATALIWKDVIMEIVRRFAPQQNALIYEIIVAIAATVILIVVLSIILKTESQARFIMKRLKDGTVKFEKAPKQSNQTQTPRQPRKQARPSSTHSSST